MELSKMKEELSQYGEIQICKADSVFTLLMTGEGLGDMKKVIKIQDIISTHVVKRFPVIECAKNDDNFICIVLKNYRYAT